jgi:predicted dehydrogenase
MSRVLSTGVIGGGLIAQAVHLPNLTALSDRFTVAAIADPSRKVGDALARQYAPARSYLDWRDMLAREALDAVVVCSPHATHAEIVLDALDRGLDVFVEKPLCIVPEDADVISARAEAVGRVAQVGYMKRFSAAYEQFVAGLPRSADGLRLVDVVTYDPWMAREPFVPWRRMVQADDVPSAVLAAAAASERDQVEQAVGTGDAETVRAFSYAFLSALVHDINLVHGALEAMGVTGRAEALAGAAWADGTAATATLRLPNGARWHSSWLLLDRLMDFRERVGLYFTDAVHELEFPAPYAVDVPVTHAVIDAPVGSHRARVERLVNHAYVTELEHFHDCAVAGTACRTPASQAAKDIAVLRDLFSVRQQFAVPGVR